MTVMADYRHPPHIRRVLTSLAPIACPPEIEELGLVDDVVDHMELSMCSLPIAVRAGLLAGLTSYELAARAWPAHLGRPASRLPRDRATRYFDWWRHGTFLQQQFIKGVKGLLCLGYYEMPAVKEMIGYTPEQWIDKVKRKRLTVYADDIRRHEESILAPDPLPPMKIGQREIDAEPIAEKEAS